MISSFNQETADPFRDSYGQCSRVSEMKVNLKRSTGWACKMDDVRTWAAYRRVAEGVLAESNEMDCRCWRKSSSSSGPATKLLLFSSQRPKAKTASITPVSSLPILAGPLMPMKC